MLSARVDFFDGPAAQCGVVEVGQAGQGATAITRRRGIPAQSVQKTQVTPARLAVVSGHTAAVRYALLGIGLSLPVCGEHPGLEAGKLLRGDLAFHTDFRQVYATLLENWLGAEAAPILGGSFAKLAFV